MKLASFEYHGNVEYGVVTGDHVAPADTQIGAPPTIRAYLASCEAGVPPSLPLAASVPLDAVRLLPAIPDPGKIICVATNFHEPAREGKPLPEYPLLFTRFAASIVGHGSSLEKPSVSEQYDFEGEVAIVIGKPGDCIAREKAMEHVAGYTCFNDGSVRDWQRHSTQFTPGKNFRRSGAFGPWILTANEVSDPSTLRLATRVNGVERQAIGLDSFIFDIPWLIAYISVFSPLETGDVIVTGTPSGFGSSRNPPEFLKSGDVVEVEVSGIGILRNEVG